MDWVGFGLGLEVCVEMILVGREENEENGREEALRESSKGFLVLNGLYGNVDLDLGWDFYFSLAIS